MESKTKGAAPREVDLGENFAVQEGTSKPHSKEVSSTVGPAKEVVHLLRNCKRRVADLRY